MSEIEWACPACGWIDTSQFLQAESCPSCGGVLKLCEIGTDEELNVTVTPVEETT